MLATARELFLLIDDNQDDARLFGRALKRAQPHAQMVVLSTLRAGFAYLAEICSFSLFRVHGLPITVAVDLGLPDGCGTDLIHWIRTEPALNHARVMVVTGEGNSKDAREAASCTETSFFVKPVESHHLSTWLAGTPAAGA